MRTILELAEESYAKQQRIVAPLMGFPGLQYTNCTIKAAQENAILHFAAIKALADEFKPDIIFPMMDLSLEANALGMPTIFTKNISGVIQPHSYSPMVLENINNVSIAKDKRIQEYLKTVGKMRDDFSEDIIIGAYVTGSFTLAALIMGMTEMAEAVKNRSSELMRLLEICTVKIQDFIKELIMQGAELICFLEPSSSLLTSNQIEEFSCYYIKELVNDCQQVNTVLHICGNSMPLISQMAKTGVDGLSLDSPDAGVDLARIAEMVPSEMVIFGNLNPTGTILLGSPKEVRQEVDDLLNKMINYPNFVLSTGCDLPQRVPLENIKAFMEAGRVRRGWKD